MIRKILFYGWAAALLGLFAGCFYYIILAGVEYNRVIEQGGNIIRYLPREKELEDKAQVLLELALYVGAGGGAIIFLVWLVSQVRRK